MTISLNISNPLEISNDPTYDEVEIVFKDRLFFISTDYSKIMIFLLS